MSFLSLLGRSSKTLHPLYFIATVSVFFCIAVYAEAPLSKENKLKAAYLLNFIRFIEWPAKAESKSPTTVRVCVDTPSEFQQFFSQLVDGRRVGPLQSKVTVVSFTAGSTCDLLYIQGKDKPVFEQVDNVVVVADSGNLSVPSAVILFYSENRKLRFEIYLEKIKKLNIIVSSELMKLARLK